MLMRRGNDGGVTAVGVILRRASIQHLFVSGDRAKVKTLRPDTVCFRSHFLS